MRFSGRTCCLLCLLLTGLAAGGSSAAELTPRDWPMLAHDVMRSGATPHEVKPPMARAWVRYFQMEGIMPSVQPVVVGELLYLGTLGGTFHCLDARTGQDVWKQTVGAPVFHTACVTPEGLVVFGLGDGRVQALQCADGRPAWHYRTGAPLWNAPLAHAGRVFIGGRDGFFYCLDAASGDPASRLVWKFDARAPICQSPALDPKRERVYFTSEALIVHALDAKTGRELWHSEQLPGVTACSFHPVIAPDGTVLTNTVPFYNWDRCHEPLEKVQAELFGVEELGKDASNYPGRYTKLPNWRFKKETNQRYEEYARKTMLDPAYFGRQLAGLRRQLEQDPACQCLFLLDPETGKRRASTPVCYTAFAKSAFTPPLVAPDGKVVTKWWALLPSTFTAYQREVNLAYLDTANGDLLPVFDETRMDSGKALHLIADEACQFSIGGRYLFNVNIHHGEFLNYFDLADPQRKTLGEIYNTQLHAYGIGVLNRILRHETDKVDLGQEDLTPGFAVNGENATGNNLTASQGIVPAAGKIFWLAANKIIALEPAPKPPVYKKGGSAADFGIAPLTPAELQTLYQTWPVNWDKVEVKPKGKNWEDHKINTPDEVEFPAGTRQRPDDEAARKAEAVPDSKLDEYIWEASKPGALPGDPPTEALKARLFEAVEELLSKPRWAPYRFQGGKHPSDYLEFFTEPAELGEALGYAYPFLSPELQAQTKAYVRAEWTARHPLAARECPSEQGEPRELYAVPKAGGRIFRLAREMNVERAYPVWLWAHVSGDWDLAKPGWDRVKSGFQAKPQLARDAGNACCGGLIAACRLARQFGDNEALEKNLPAARKALRDRLGFEFRFHRGHVANDQIGLWRGFTRWTFLTPEVGRLLREQAPDVAAPLVLHYLDRLRPYWCLSFGPLTPEGRENSMQLPTNAWSAFQAQAFIAAPLPERLATCADIRSCRADLYWIGKLALVLHARSNATWASLK